MESMLGSKATVYVNTKEGWLYLYGRNELVDHIKKAALRGFERGMGRSNEDTHAVLVPVARSVWRRKEGGWVWHGKGAEGAGIDSVRRLLTAS